MLIHVGYHKTGSTSLQRHAFVAEKGICAPWTVESGEAIEHFVLAHECRFCPDKVREQFEAAVKKSAGDRPLQPVISHEDLCGYPVYGRYYGFAVAARLKATFPQAKVLIVIREQKSLIRSLYGQYIRQDGEWPIGMFIGNGKERIGFRPPCRLDHFEYDLLICRYRELFGPAAVLIQTFESLQRDPIVFEQRIHDFLGTGFRVPSNAPIENAGFGAMTLAINRRFNWLFKSPPLKHVDQTRESLSLRLKEKACRSLDALLPGRWQRGRDTALRRAIAERVGDYYRASNQRLAEMTQLDLRGFGYDL